MIINKNKINFIIKNYKFNFVFFIFSLFLFSPVFFLTFNNYQIGFSWDWSIPNAELVFNRLLEQLSSINRSYNTGIILGYNFELFYWIIISILTLIFKEYYLYVFLVLFSTINCIYTFKIFPKNSKSLISLLLVLFYAQNFFFISRFLAGHLPFLMVFYIFPVFFYHLNELRQNIHSNLLCKNFLIIIFLSFLMFVNITGVITYFAFLIFLLIYKIKNFRFSFKLILIILLSIFSNLHIFLFLFLSLFDQSLIGSHDIRDFNYSADFRVNEQTVKKSFSLFQLPFRGLFNSMFYETMSARPLLLRFFNGIVYLTIFITPIYYYYKANYITKNIHYYFFNFLLVFIIATGFDNFIISTFYNLNFLKVFYILYSNPLRFYSLLAYISILLLINISNLYAINFLKNKFLIYFILILVCSNLFFDLFVYKSNFSYKNHTQNEKINYIKDNYPSELVNIIGNQLDFNKLSIPPYYISYPLYPMSPYYWQSFFYKQSDLFIQNKFSFSNVILNNLFSDLDKDEFIEVLKERSVKYIIYSKAEKYLLYDRDLVKNSIELNNDLENLPDTTNLINGNLSKLFEYIVYESDNYIVYEFDYLPRVHAVHEKNIIDLKFKHLLNGIYLIESNVLKKNDKIILTDLYNDGYFMINFNGFESLMNIKKLLKEKITSNEYNFGNSFSVNSTSKYKLILHSSLIYYLPVLIISITIFILLPFLFL